MIYGRHFVPAIVRSFFLEEFRLTSHSISCIFQRKLLPCSRLRGEHSEARLLGSREMVIVLSEAQAIEQQ